MRVCRCLQPCPDVYTFPLISETFARELVEVCVCVCVRVCWCEAGDRVHRRWSSLASGVVAGTRTADWTVAMRTCPLEIFT